jgi:hypothetical protein
VISFRLNRDLVVEPCARAAGTAIIIVLSPEPMSQIVESTMTVVR